MEFDPYLEWLRIPVNRRPPTHYDLLGLPVFEADPRRITDAAMGQIAFVRKYEVGNLGEHATIVLVELHKAFDCLLDAERKGAYDRVLRGQGTAAEPARTDAPSTADAGLPAPFVGQVQDGQAVATATPVQSIPPPTVRLAPRPLTPIPIGPTSPEESPRPLAGEGGLSRPVWMLLAAGILAPLVLLAMLALRQSRPDVEEILVKETMAEAGSGNDIQQPVEGPGSDTAPESIPSNQNPPIRPGDVIDNSIGMKLVLIPAGEFQMGSPENEVGRQQDETLHHVRLTKDFFLGQTEVTQAEYEAVMGTNPSYFSEAGDGKATVAGLDTSAFPVEQVSWDDAQEFCRRLTTLAAEKTAGREYRLPTEAEWEYACRSGTQTVFAFGDSLTSSQANFDGNYPYGGAAKGQYLERLATVGSYTANAFGLLDMHGNVWEWCEDWYYAAFPGGAAVDPKGPDSGARRVLRGGGWNGNASICRVAYRVRHAPSNRFRNYGFRVVLDVRPLVNQSQPAPLPLPPKPVASEPSPNTIRPGDVIENSIGMKLVLIPAGEFQMGSPVGEEGRFTDETQHRVRLTEDFFLGQMVVTQAEYEAVMGTNPSYYCSTGGGKSSVNRLDTSAFPVEQVSWEDAQEFCRRLTARAAEKSAGRTYRLPTEAEWEYACRGGTQSVFAFGDSLTSSHANFDWGRPVTVGSYNANAFGLLDMHGNVWEWCQDAYQSGYEKLAADNPVALGSAGADRVIRGGSWGGSASVCRSANRLHDSAAYRSSSVGFRVGASSPLRGSR